MRCCSYIKDAWNAVDLASTVLFLLFLILRFSGVTAINQLVVENDKVDFNDVLGVVRPVVCRFVFPLRSEFAVVFCL